MSELEFKVLGPLEAVRDGRRVHIGGPKQRELLSLLLLRAGRPVSTDGLVDALWGDRPPATAVKTIHKYVSQLRKYFSADDIVTVAGGYLLKTDESRVDAALFEHLVDRASGAGTPEEKARLIEDALALWRGSPWPDVPDDPFAAAERSRLEERRLVALEDLMDAELAQGHHRTLVGRLEGLVTEHPLRERIWGQLMTALYRSGRQAEALDAYRRLRAALLEQLGLEPSVQLQDLEGRLLRQAPDLAPPETSTVVRSRNTNIPAQITTFVGRRRELTQIQRLLETARLVTLTGVGGCGKTRLALEAGARTLGRRRDGVWLVALEAVSDPGLVEQTIASVLGLRDQPGSSLGSIVVDYLRHRRMLLILDNCEHLVGACARVAEKLLRSCEDLQILATSRESLGITGETVWQVPPMPLPQSDGLPVEALRHHEAIELFVDRATSVSSGFELTADNGDIIAKICRRLDGLPLALELAATRVGSLGLSDIADRLEDRFVVLTQGSRTAAARQRTLHATVDWSYELLNDAERLLFDRLSVFAGGFTLDSVEQVCSGDGIDTAEIMNLLSALINKSLVPRVVGAGAARYQVLETLRRYGWERLRERGAADEMRRRHAMHFLAVAKGAEPEIRGPRPTIWLDRLEEENDNLRAALDWGCDNGDIGLRLAIALELFWERRGYVSEGLDWLDRALSASSHVERDARARGLVIAGYFALARGESDRAEALAGESMRLFRELGHDRGIAQATHVLGWAAQHRGAYEDAAVLLKDSLGRYERLQASGDDPRGARDVALVLHHLGMVARQRGDYEGARALHERSLEIMRKSGDVMRVGYALWMLGVVSRYEGDYEMASTRCEEALQLLSDLRDRSGVAHVRYTLGDVARLQNDPVRSEALYRQSLTELRDVGDRGCVASTLGSLASLALRLPDPARASALLGESLNIRCALGDKAGIAECLEGLADIDAAGGRHARAAQLFGAAESLRAETGGVRPASERPDHERRVAAIRAALSKGDFSDAWQRGRSDPGATVTRAIERVGHSDPGAAVRTA